MDAELIDIYDENNALLGITRMKSEAHRDGLWHRAVHVFLFDDEGSVLLQLRNKNRDVNPDRWSPAAAGHVSSGESISAAAIRETREEIGIYLIENDLGVPILSSIDIKLPNGTTNAEFRYIFFVRHRTDMDNVTLQESEVSDVKILSIDQLETQYHERPESFSFEGDGYWENAFAEIRSRLA
ncbi:MAG: NUDIX domain-containing protein [Candidatus Moranbacteria bacterium]|nr:NUDIX domain-containing protein [Candidatus Moranbacteria bacterium]